MPNDSNVNIGNSGEYFVAGELERRGFTVAVPMSNVKDFDLLAIERNTHKQIAIQVKTTGYKQKKWTLSKKNEVSFYNLDNRFKNLESNYIITVSNKKILSITTFNNDELSKIIEGLGE